jgi:hypothetical protein
MGKIKIHSNVSERNFIDGKKAGSCEDDARRQYISHVI